MNPKSILTQLTQHALPRRQFLRGVSAPLALPLLDAMSVTDPITLTAISLRLTLVCMLASYILARLATKVDLMAALRYIRT